MAAKTGQHLTTLIKKGHITKWCHVQLNTLSFMKKHFKDIFTGSIWRGTKIHAHPFHWYPQNHIKSLTATEIACHVYIYHIHVHTYSSTPQSHMHIQTYRVIFMFDILGKYKKLKYQNKTFFIPFLKLITIRYVWTKSELNYLLFKMSLFFTLADSIIWQYENCPVTKVLPIF